MDIIILQKYYFYPNQCNYLILYFFGFSLSPSKRILKKSFFLFEKKIYVFPSKDSKNKSI